MRIITGCGRCGTSLMAKIFKEYGFNLGSDRWIQDARCGLECEEVAKLNWDIGMFLNKPLVNPDLFSREEIARAVTQFEPEIRTLSLKYQWVKDPKFSKTLEIWLEAGAEIDFVVICVRNHWDVALSAIDTGACIDSDVRNIQHLPLVCRNLAARTGNLFYVVHEFEIPYVVAAYPQDYLAGLPRVGQALKLDLDKLHEISWELFQFPKYSEEVKL